jgi:hypothetical protein
VDDYKTIKSFMDNVNDTFENLKISYKYNYDDFCIDIRNNIIHLMVTENLEEISTELLVSTLNNMIKFKILDDEDYEEKIKVYFEEPDKILDDINILKIKNIRKKP